MSFIKHLAKILFDVLTLITCVLYVGLIAWAAGMMLVYAIGGVLLLCIFVAVSAGSGGYGSYGSDDDSGWQCRPYDYNPATGLPMVGGVDTGGSPFGCDNNQHW